MGVGMDMGIGPTHPIPILSVSPQYLFISAPYKTHIYLFKFLICYLYLNTLLVALSYMILKNSTEHFI